MQRENNRTKLGGFVLFFPLAGVGNSESGSVLTFMIYDKYTRRSGDILKRMQRWVNSKRTFAVVREFEEYR